MADLPPHRFIMGYKLDRPLMREAPDVDGVDIVRLVAIEDNGQRWGFVRRLYRSTSTERVTVGREEDRGWMRLPSEFLDGGETFDTRQVPEA